MKRPTHTRTPAALFRIQSLERRAQKGGAPLRAEFCQIFGDVIGDHLANKILADASPRIFWLWPVLDTANREKLAAWVNLTPASMERLYSTLDRHPIPAAAQVLNERYF